MALIITLMSVVLLVMAAFAVDIANAFAVKRQLSVAADASAIAAAQEVNKQIPAGTGVCNAAALQPVAQAAADTQNRAARGDATLDSVTVDCSNWPTDVRVAVVNRRSAPTFFGQFAGLNGLSAANAATARIFVPDQATGLRPIAACTQNVIDAGVGTTNAPFVVSVSKDNAVCGTTGPGNWGFTNFLDQGAFGVYNNSASPIYNPSEPCANGNANSGGQAGCQSEWTENGYQGRVIFPNLIASTQGLSGNTGVSNSSDYRDAFRGLVGQVISLPVASVTQGSGSNLKLNVTGVITVQVCAVKHWQNSGTNIPAGPTACGTNQPTSAAIGFPNWTLKSGDAAIWVKPVLYQTSAVTGGPRANCFTDASCDFGQRAVQLYR